jgi:hypothetical protein
MEATRRNNTAFAAPASPSLSGFLSRARAYAASGRWVLPAIYTGAAFLITNLYWQGAEQLETATLDKFVGVAANKPFAYRILMPYLIGVTAELNGISLKYADICLRICVLFGTMLLLRRWLRHFVDPLLADILPLTLGIILPWSFDYYWPYDFSGILIWTAALLCLFERRYFSYTLLFILGALNRETAFFLIPIFGLTQWDALGKGRALKWMGALFAIWLTIFVTLRLLIHPRAGEGVEIHIVNNFEYLTRGYGLGPYEHWMRLLSGLGFLWLLAPWYWSKKHPFLRRACWLLPAYFLVMFVVARFVETRVWYEWIPICLALAGHSLMEFARRETSNPLPVGGSA